MQPPRPSLLSPLLLLALIACAPSQAQPILAHPAPPPRLGAPTAPNVYEVHRRVLWDIGWLQDAQQLTAGQFTFNEHPRALIYGADRTLFLNPLFGYGAPEPQPGATRTIRLYAVYGHQWMCEGKPTVSVGDVEFYLPTVHGYFGDIAAGYSEPRAAAELAHVKHAPVSVYLKDFRSSGDHCGPGDGAERPKGVIQHLEVVHYDTFEGGQR